MLLSLFMMIAVQSRQLTVEEWWPPVPVRPGDNFVWYSLGPAGDVAADGATDVVAFSSSLPDPLSGQTRLDVLDFVGVGGWKHEVHAVVPIPGTAFYFAGARLRLATASGDVLYLLDGYQSTPLQVYDSQTLALLHSIPRPPPPAPGIRAAYGYRGLAPAGDVNHDGFDDAFWWEFNAPYGYCGLLDGATRSVVWQYYSDNVDFIQEVPHGQPGPMPDFDNDGTADFLFNGILANGHQVGHRVVALSGVSGALIWNRSGLGSAAAITQGEDIDRDGSPDLMVIRSPETIEAWSGTDGQTIWSQHIDGVNGHFRAGWTGRQFRSPFLMSRTPFSTAPEVLVSVEYSYPSVPSIENGMAVFAGQSGQLSEVIDFPVDLKPWSVDLLEGSLVLFPVGDLDRDGSLELACRLPAPSATPPWSAGFPSHQVAILGLQNLRMPATARAGELVTASLSVSTAPGSDFLLLASTSFDPLGGFTRGDWRTHLPATDPLLLLASTSSSLRGRLHSDGIGSLALRIPSHPWFIGRDLYFRALVRKPGSNEIWTRSSLGVLEVLP